MNNVVRKAIRVIIDELGQLSDACPHELEKQCVESARICLVRADYYDFHLNPKKRYVEPKSDFKYVKK